jgi:hypothetical protein
MHAGSNAEKSVEQTLLRLRQTVRRNAFQCRRGIAQRCQMRVAVPRRCRQLCSVAWHQFANDTTRQNAATHLLQNTALNSEPTASVSTIEAIRAVPITNQNDIAQKPTATTTTKTYETSH